MDFANSFSETEKGRRGARMGRMEVGMGGWADGSEDGRLGRMGGWVPWMCAMMLAVLLFVGRAHVDVDGCRTGTCIDVG